MVGFDAAHLAGSARPSVLGSLQLNHAHSLTVPHAVALGRLGLQRNQSAASGVQKIASSTHNKAGLCLRPEALSPRVSTDLHGAAHGGRAALHEGGTVWGRSAPSSLPRPARLPLRTNIVHVQRRARGWDSKERHTELALTVADATTPVRAATVCMMAWLG